MIHHRSKPSRFRAARTLALGASIAALAMSAATVAAAAATPPRTAATQPCTSKKVTSVHYVTGFGTFGRDAYVYVAMKKGFFARAGINVTVDPGPGTVGNMQLVASGAAQFGIATAPSMAVTMASAHLPLIAVAAIQQRNPAGLMVLSSSGITSLPQMAGKTYADSPSSETHVMFSLYARAAHLDPSTVTWVPATPQTLPALLGARTVDAVAQSAFGKATIEAAVKQPVTFLPFAPFLPIFYGNLLITNTSILKSNPQLVRCFVGALLQGLAYSNTHPDETGQILHEYQPLQDPTLAADEVRALSPYVLPRGFRSPIGTLSAERVKEMLNFLQMSGMLQAPLRPSEFASTAFVTPPAKAQPAKPAQKAKKKTTTKKS